MPIKPGERIPSMTFKYLEGDTMKQMSTDELFKGRVVLVGVPGAFTSVCSKKHLPGYVKNSEAILAKGVKRIVCMAVNDPFVMDAWIKASGGVGKINVLPDGNGALTKAMGLEMDATGYGMGARCVRFSALIENSIVKTLDIDSSGEVNLSSAENMMKKL